VALQVNWGFPRSIGKVSVVYEGVFMPGVVGFHDEMVIFILENEI